MTADELRAMTEQGPAVVMVSREDMLALLDEREWRPIETAPLSTTTPSPHGNVVRAVYLLGFCPDESALDPQGCIEVIWWEPHLDGGRWQSAADVPIRPTHWMPLPRAPR